MSLLDSHGADGLGSVLDSVLVRHRCKVDRLAPGVWRAAGHAVEPFVVKAADGWLTIHGSAPEEIARQPPSTLLGYASSLPGHTKLVAGVQDDGISLRAELPLDAEADLAAQLPAIVAAFAAREKDVAETSCCVDEATGQVSDNQHTASLSERCAEAGWPAVERPTGELAVELEVPGIFVQATLHQYQDCGWWVDVPLVSGEPATTGCREATARLLLRVSRLVRLVQAALIPAQGGTPPGFRVWLPSTAFSSAFGHAFAALSIGCRLCAREAAVLWHDERIAQAYLDRALAARTPEQ